MSCETVPFPAVPPAPPDFVTLAAHESDVQSLNSKIAAADSRAASAEESADVALARAQAASGAATALATRVGDVETRVTALESASSGGSSSGGSSSGGSSSGGSSEPVEADLSGVEKRLDTIENSIYAEQSAEGYVDLVQSLMPAVFGKTWSTDGLAKGYGVALLEKTPQDSTLSAASIGWIDSNDWKDPDGNFCGFYRGARLLVDEVPLVSAAGFVVDDRPLSSGSGAFAFATTAFAAATLTDYHIMKHVMVLGYNGQQSSTRDLLVGTLDNVGGHNLFEEVEQYVATQLKDFTVPSLDGYVTSEALKSYVTSLQLEAELKTYMQVSSLEGYLTESQASAKYAAAVEGGYVSNSELTSKLASYVTSDDLTSKLASYVTSKELDGKGYLTQSAADGAYQAKGSYVDESYVDDAVKDRLTTVTADERYVKKEDFDGDSYLTFDVADRRYSPIATTPDGDAYLSVQSAQDTYLTKTDAATTYVTTDGLSEALSADSSGWLEQDALSDAGSAPSIVRLKPGGYVFLIDDASPGSICFEPDFTELVGKSPCRAYESVVFVVDSTASGDSVGDYYKLTAPTYDGSPFEAEYYVLTKPTSDGSIPWGKLVTPDASFSLKSFIPDNAYESCVLKFHFRLFPYNGASSVPDHSFVLVDVETLTIPMNE